MDSGSLLELSFNVFLSTYHGSGTQWILEGLQSIHGILESDCTVQTPTRLLISSVTRGKLFNLLVP